MVIPSCLPLLYLFVSGASSGLHLSVIKIALQSGLSQSGIVLATIAGVAVVLLLVALLRRRPPTLDLAHLHFYSGFALCLCPIVGQLSPQSSN
jgi:uncharacterized membrane protein